MSTPITRFYSAFDVDEGEVWSGSGRHPAQVQLFSFRIHHTNPTDLYLQLWEGDPNNAGSRLRHSVIVPKGQNVHLDFEAEPEPFAAIQDPPTVALFWALQSAPSAYAGVLGSNVGYVSARTKELSLIP